MIKVKDGYAKLVGTTASGSASHILLSNGGIKAVSDFAAASALDNYLPLIGGVLSGHLSLGTPATTALLLLSVERNNNKLSMLVSGADEGWLVHKYNSGKSTALIQNETRGLIFKDTSDNYYDVWHSGNLKNLSDLNNDLYWANINITSSPDSTKIPTLGGLNTTGVIQSSSNYPAYLTSIGTGVYNKTVIMHSTDGLIIERARKTESSSGDIISLIISQRGGGNAVTFKNNDVLVSGRVESTENYVWEKSAKYRVTTCGYQGIGRIYNYNEETATYGDLYLGYNGANGITIKGDTFRVGIGTSSPTLPLSVNGQERIIASANASSITLDTCALIIGPNSSGHSGYSTGIGFNSLSYGAYINHIHAWIGLGPYTTTATAECYPLIFATNGSTTTNTAPVERMRITPDGNIGIGDSNPAYKLEVAGSICGTVIYANRDASTTAGGVSLYSNSDPMTYGIAFRGTGTYGTHGYVTAANDWATYLTMSDTLTRGWIFRRGSTNVASIAGNGNMAIGQNLKFSNEAHISTNRSTDYHYGYTFNLEANAQSIGMYSGPVGEAGGVVISPDGCLIYNSSDSGYNLQVRDKDLGSDLTNIATLTFGIEQTGYYAWSRGGFKKNGSDDTYVLLGGGGHKLESNLSVSSARTASRATTANMISHSTYYYSGNVMKNNTSADTIFGTDATANYLFPSFMESHPIFNNYADVINFTGYCKWGGTQLATEYNAINPRVAIRKYNQSRSNWGDWTELLSNKNGVRWGGWNGTFEANTPASAVKSRFTASYMPDGNLLTYNTAGNEYTLLMTCRPDILHGSALKWGYPDRYIRILRFINGTAQTTDWEKIAAGYADSAGSATNASYYTLGPSSTFTNVWNCNTPDRIVYSDYGSSGRNVSNAPAGWSYGTLLELGHMNYRGQNANLNLQLMWDVAHGTTNGGTLWFRGNCSTYKWAKNWCKVLSDQNYSSYALPLSGGWMNKDATIYFKNPAGGTSPYAGIGYRTSVNGTMHCTSAANASGAFYIFSNGYDSANDFGGIAIDNEGVTVFGAGDPGNNFTGIFRVLNEDNPADGPLFIVTKSSGATVKYNMYAAHFYENSDIRYKTIINNLAIKANQLANLPLFDFKWLDNEDLLNTGTSAQAVQELLPYIVSGTDKLTLDYGVLGTIAGITACKELTEQEKEINELKEQIKFLKDEINNLKTNKLWQS